MQCIQDGHRPLDWTADEVIQWLSDIISKGKIGVISTDDRMQLIESFKSNEIDGETLEQLPNDKEEFPRLVTKAATRMKLKSEIKLIFQDSRPLKRLKQSHQDSTTNADAGACCEGCISHTRYVEWKINKFNSLGLICRGVRKQQS